MLSVWEQQAFPKHSDLLVIGAGLTGLLTAIFVKTQRPTWRVRILERGIHPSGASVKNAGFGCFGSASELLDDIRNEGDTLAIDRVARRYEGLQRLLSIARLSSDHLQQQGGHEVFTLDDAALFDECHQALDYLNDLLEPLLSFRPFSEENNTWNFHALEKAIFIKNEISLHSGQLLQNLVSEAQRLGVLIHTGIEVQGLENQGDLWEAFTGSGVFSAAKVAVAINGYTRQLLPDLPVEPARGQILLTSQVSSLKLEGNFHLYRGYYYFRQFNGRILLGGGRHLFRANENSFSTETTEEVQEELERVLLEIILPDKSCSIEQRWAGTMAFGPDNEKEAIVEELRPGLFAGVRLGGMGVALASAVAEDLAGKITK